MADVEGQSGAPVGLLSAVARGEAGAAERAARAYGPLVWSVARTYCRDMHDAEDAAQEAFVRLWRLAARHDPARGSEPSFVAVVSRGAVIDYLRQRGRRVVPVALEASGNTPAAPAVPGAGLTEEVGRAAALLAAIPAEQREVLELAIGRGMTHETIATSLKLPLGTVKTRVRSALMKLREAMTTDRSSTKGGTR